MPIDQDASSEQRLTQWLKKHRSLATVLAIVACLGLGLGLGGLTWWAWGWLGTAQPGSDSNSAVLRNVSLVAAGALSVVLVIWRNRVASRQAQAAVDQAAATRQQAESIADQARATLAQAESAQAQAREQTRASIAQVEASQAQIEVAQAEKLEANRRALDSQFESGEASLSSEGIAARISGIEVLRRLGLEASEPYLSRVVQILCTFTRHSTGQVPLGQDAPEDRVRAVVAAAMTYQRLRELDPTTDTSLDFSETDLTRADLVGVDLSGGHFSRARMARALLENANLTNAYLDDSNLIRARLWGASLTNAKLGFSTAYLANFRRATLAGAHLNAVGLAGADFTDADLSGTDVTAARFVPPRDEYQHLIEFLDMETYAQPSEIVAIGLTQEQLDAAVADPEWPPLLDGLKDAATDEPLVWRGETPG